MTNLDGPPSPGTNLDPTDVNRFVSTFAGAFRTFYMYKDDNKVFDEIMQNLTKRFSDTVANGQTLKLGITNRSLVFEGKPSGFKDITLHLAAELTNLGFKEILFLSPLQGRHFFQFLHILSSKEGEETKVERLTPFLNDGQEKPISLVSLEANASIVRLSDDLLSSRLSSLLVPQEKGGPGFMETLGAVNIGVAPDLFDAVLWAGQPLLGSVKTFLFELTNTTRHGYFPLRRYLHLLPMQSDQKERLLKMTGPARRVTARHPSSLGHRLIPQKIQRNSGPSEWISDVIDFDNDQVKRHQSFRAMGNQTSANDDLDMAAALLRESGPDAILGFRFLLRYMADTTAVGVQEKALKIGVDVWKAWQDRIGTPEFASLLSSLRQHLTDTRNVSLALFPLRNAVLESAAFVDTTAYLVSLGKAIFSPMLSALDAEPDRGMRKKLCHVLTVLSRENGVDGLKEAIPKASVFLLRNIVMVLGDMKSPDAVPIIASFSTHQQRMIRAETIRSLMKIGTEQATKAILVSLAQLQDVDIKQTILDFIAIQKPAAAMPVLLRLAKEENAPVAWRRSLYIAIGACGGAQAKTFLQSLNVGGGMFGRFNTEQREEAALVKSLLEKIKP